MPVSSPLLDAHMTTILRLMQPAKVCDIGPGAGKYGQLVRQLATLDGFTSSVTAYDIDASYVEHFGLREIYDEVVVGDAVDLIKDVRRRFDLVIIGDCIEHLRKSDGIDLINFLVYRSGYIAIAYPERYVQDDWHGHEQEAHISVWSREDFRALSFLEVVVGNMHLFLIRGYQDVSCEFHEFYDGGVRFSKQPVP